MRERTILIAYRRFEQLQELLFVRGYLIDPGGRDPNEWREDPPLGLVRLKGVALRGEGDRAEPDPRVTFNIVEFWSSDHVEKPDDRRAAGLRRHALHEEPASFARRRRGDRRMRRPTPRLPHRPGARHGPQAIRAASCPPRPQLAAEDTTRLEADRDAEEYCGEPGESLEPYIHEIFAAGPREAWEQEQLVPGVGAEAFDDPILESTELSGRADRDRARGLLVGLLAEEPRCLDAYAHLGAFAYDYAATLAMPHYEAGVAVGERSLPKLFDGVLPCGWIDNRPFMRCLHGYGLCLWRLGRFGEAEVVFTAMLWLNPGDNQGARELVEAARGRMRWEPTPRRRGEGWPGRGNGRRALLDRASLALEVAPRTPPGSEIEAAFEPLSHNIDRHRRAPPLHG